MYIIEVDNVMVYSGLEFPAIGILDVCMKLARHFNVTMSATYNGVEFSW